MGLFNKKSSAARAERYTREALRSLALRLNLSSGDNAPRIIAFMAARAGEGTSTLALKYAVLLSQETGKKVLLVDASPNISGDYAKAGLTNKTGIIDAALNDESIGTAIKEIVPNLYAVRWVGKLQHRAVADRVMQSPEFWKKLQSEFGYIVIDTPSLQKSFDGIVLAAKADCSVLVVEAEATPTPVTQHLRDVLVNAGAKVAGVVLTKRRYYIPQKAYNKL